MSTSEKERRYFLAVLSDVARAILLRWPECECESCELTRKRFTAILEDIQEIDKAEEKRIKTTLKGE